MADAKTARTRLGDGAAADAADAADLSLVVGSPLGEQAAAALARHGLAELLVPAERTIWRLAFKFAEEQGRAVERRLRLDVPRAKGYTPSKWPGPSAAVMAAMHAKFKGAQSLRINCRPTHPGDGVGVPEWPDGPATAAPRLNASDYLHTYLARASSIGALGSLVSCTLLQSNLLHKYVNQVGESLVAAAPRLQRLRVLQAEKVSDYADGCCRAAPTGWLSALTGLCGLTSLVFSPRIQEHGNWVPALCALTGLRELSVVLEPYNDDVADKYDLTLPSLSNALPQLEAITPSLLPFADSPDLVTETLFPRVHTLLSGPCALDPSGSWVSTNEWAHARPPFDSFMCGACVECLDVEVFAAQLPSLRQLRGFLVVVRSPPALSSMKKWLGDYMIYCNVRNGVTVLPRNVAPHVHVLQLPMPNDRATALARAAAVYGAMPNVTHLLLNGHQSMLCDYAVQALLALPRLQEMHMLIDDGRCAHGELETALHQDVGLALARMAGPQRRLDFLAGVPCWIKVISS